LADIGIGVNYEHVAVRRQLRFDELNERIQLGSELIALDYGPRGFEDFLTARVAQASIETVNA